MGAANWLRRASGLLLPRTHFAQPYPCPNCCDGGLGEPGEPCGCTCSYCSSTSEPAYMAPCCWTVVISGITDGTCTDCSTLNRAYYLYQDSANSCRWCCLNVTGVDCLGSNDICLTVYLDGDGHYKIRVDQGEHRWVKDYGLAAPLCCEIVGDELDSDTSGSDCDSSSATCTITRHTGDGRPCPCPSVDCPNAISPPSCFKIEWEGVSPRDPPASWQNCWFCDCYDITPQWIPWEGYDGSRCTWRRYHGGHLCDLEIAIRIFQFGGGYRLQVVQGWPTNIMYQKDYASKPDVLTWDQEEIPRRSGARMLECNYTADAKVLLTPDYTTACDDLPWTCQGCDCGQDADRPDVLVTLSGVPSAGDPCCDDFNGEFVLTPQPLGGTFGGGCGWRYVFPDEGECEGGSTYIHLNIMRMGETGKPYMFLLLVRRARPFAEFRYIDQPRLECDDFNVTFNWVDLDFTSPYCRGHLMPFPTAATI